MKKIMIMLLCCAMLIPCLNIYASAGESEKEWYYACQVDCSDGVIIKEYVDFDNPSLLPGETVSYKIETEGIPEDAEVTYKWTHMATVPGGRPTDTVKVDLAETGNICTVVCDDSVSALRTDWHLELDIIEADCHLLVCKILVNGVEKYEMPGSIRALFTYGPRKCADIGGINDNWYSIYIRSANISGMLNAPLFDTDDFYPQKTDITRSVFCAMWYGYNWYNHVNYPLRGIFKDVTADHPYFYEIEKCYDAGLVAGVGNGMFDPDRIITRQEIAVMIYAQAKKAEDFKDAEDASSLYRFEDRNSVAWWAEDAVAWCVENGFFSGALNNGKLYFSPTEPVTRAEICCILCNK